MESESYSDIRTQFYVLMLIDIYFIQAAVHYVHARAR